MDADVVCDFVELDLDPLPPHAMAPSESSTVLRPTASARPLRSQERRRNDVRLLNVSIVTVNRRRTVSWWHPRNARPFQAKNY